MISIDNATGRRLLVLAALVWVTAVPADAMTITYQAALSGAAEAPPNASAGTGTATVTVDTVANTMAVSTNFAGLTGITTASHIHCCVAAPGNAAVATTTPTFPGFPTGVTSGNYSQLFDMSLASSFNPGFITNNGGTVSAARAVLFAGLDAGQAYLNIHTTAFPGGEIRGFLLRSAVPEPGSLVLLGLGLAGLGVSRRRRR